MKKTKPGVTEGFEDQGGNWKTAAQMGLKVVPPDTLVDFDVDGYQVDDPDDMFESELCILPASRGRNSPDFDYRYDLAKVSNECHTEMMEVIGKSIKCAGESKITIEEVNDDWVHKQLEERFGALAIDSEEYSELFKNYKAEVLEEYKVRVAEANCILDELEESDPVEKLEVVRKSMKPVRSLKFISENDSRQSQSANVFKSGKEPYSVPRFDLEVFISENDSRQSQSANVFKKGKEPCGVPRFDLEAYVLSHFCAGQSEKSSVGEDCASLKLSEFSTDLEPCFSELKFFKFTGNLKFPLVRSILKVILAFPLGVTWNFLYEEFQRRNGYPIDFRNLGFRSFEDLLRQNNNAFTVLSGKTMILVFSTLQGNIAGVDAILRKIHHYLILMVKMLKTPIAVDQVEIEMKNIFDIDLNLRAWGFESHVLFYRVLLSMWDFDAIEIVPSDEIGLDGNPVKYFVQATCKKGTEEEAPSALEGMEIEMFDMFSVNSIVGRGRAEGSNTEGPEQNGNALPKDLSKGFSLAEFYLSNTHIDCIADCLQHGIVYFVRPDLMVTPSHFYVFLEQKVELRDNFIKEMTKQYETWKKEASWDLFAVSEDLFKSILYIAIKFEDEWARGRIVKKWKNAYKVLLVDMGLYIRNCKIEDMKYLHRRFIKIPELSICCSLQHNVLTSAFPLEDIRQNAFCHTTLTQFYNLLTGHLFGFVPFIRHEDGKWEVYMYLVPDKFNLTTILIPDVAAYLVQKKTELAGMKMSKRKKTEENKKVLPT